MPYSYSIEKIQSENYTDKDWKKYFLFRTKCAELKNEPLPLESWEKLKEISLEHINNDEEIYLVWDKNKEAGHFTFDIDYKEQRDKRFVYFRNGLINKKLNDNFLKLMFSAFLEFDKYSSFLAIESNDGVNSFIENKFNARVAGHVEYSELKIKEAQHEKIDFWFKAFPKKFINYKIKFYEDIPENLLEEYCCVFTELLFDMPDNSELGDFNITVDRIKRNQENGRKHNYCSYRYLIFNEKNKIIAKTNVAINKNKPQIMHQYMTGVLKDYRGQGISKWLKAAMFRKLVTDFPNLEKIKTDTHPENNASRELSKQMGFKKVGFKKEFLIEKENIIAFCNNG